jgi:endo-1,4-beta-D-glucanase Y
MFQLQRWKLFAANLQQSQMVLSATAKAPRAMAVALHKKGLKWKTEEAKKGEAAVTTYMEENVSVVHVGASQMVVPTVNKFIQDKDTDLFT